jgi:hypothetical protein
MTIVMLVVGIVVRKYQQHHVHRDIDHLGFNEDIHGPENLRRSGQARTVCLAAAYSLKAPFLAS